MNVDEFYADGPGWSGIDTVLDQMLAAINQPVNLQSSVGFKLTASDARHNPARGNIIHGLSPFAATPGTAYISAWGSKRLKSFTAGSVMNALQSLDDFQRNAAYVLMTDKQSGDGEDRRSYIIYPTNTAIQTRQRPLDPASWTYRILTVESEFDQMDRLAEEIAKFVNYECRLGAYSAKVTADERAEGAPWGYVFWNSTSIAGDLQYVANPTSWGKLSWHIENPQDPTIPNYFIDWLNGHAMGNGERLSWAQACSSKILFTDRQEGDGDGATLSLFYPRL